MDPFAFKDIIETIDETLVGSAFSINWKNSLCFQLNKLTNLCLSANCSYFFPGTRYALSVCRFISFFSKKFFCVLSLNFYFIWVPVFIYVVDNFFFLLHAFSF